MSSVIDFQLQNGKPKITHKNWFRALGVTRVLTDDETTLDIFDDCCKISAQAPHNDQTLADAWDRALGATDDMLAIAHADFNRRTILVMGTWWAREHGLNDIAKDFAERVESHLKPWSSKPAIMTLEEAIANLNEKERELAPLVIRSYLQTGYPDWRGLRVNRTEGNPRPLHVRRTAPGELWLLADCCYNLLMESTCRFGQLVAGNAYLQSVSLLSPCARKFDDPIDWLDISRIHGVYQNHGEEDCCFTSKYQEKADQLIASMPWEVTWSEPEDEDSYEEKMFVTYK